jgi:hypothetical protein
MLIQLASASASALDSAARARLRVALPSLAHTTEAASGRVTFEGKCYNLRELQTIGRSDPQLLQEAK